LSGVTSDLPSLSDAQLIAAFIDNVQACERTKHVGAHNRLMDHRGEGPHEDSRGPLSRD
jgi:hypothetical protein